MRWLNSITNSVDMNLSKLWEMVKDSEGEKDKLQEIVKDRETWCVAGSQREELRPWQRS